MPAFRDEGENLMEFFFAQFLRGESLGVQQGTSNERVYNTKYGEFGTGCLCLTDEHVYISVFKHLTADIPLRKKGLIGQTDGSRPYVRNQSWRIPNCSIRSLRMVRASQGSGRVALLTDAAKWEIYPLWGMELLAAGLSMAKKGQLRDVFDSTASSKGIASEEAALLEELHELKERGILTQREFGDKKRQILSSI